MPSFSRAKILHETEKAYLLAGRNTNFEKDGYLRETWIPKSVIEATEITEEEKALEYIEMMKSKGWL